jgi:hypothetical protein
MSLSPAAQTFADAPPVLRLTHGEWRRLLEQRAFLDNTDNQFQPPRRYLGRPVEIVPAPSRTD